MWYFKREDSDGYCNRELRPDRTICIDRLQGTLSTPLIASSSASKLDFAHLATLLAWAASDYCKAELTAVSGVSQSSRRLAGDIAPLDSRGHHS